ncbi:alpha/beta fold hydrolase [Oculatella sp. LEGE 06141]|uniref:dienelactone hydrolase family protein n=1 Tax=Oculatella sp. LEGE 06141 TaxID=1828648 RepID=UPI0018810676|nr:dienelactone hydrolase family protein [Oculatella sp. LEGE 06141]MBE9179079.1 alpha/beta fold hydrolase [Oculatella sp. LEGE 06141]
MGTHVENIGYLAIPSSGSGPGVVVLQEWWGLVPHIESLADRFAEAGYVALAPDLYNGTTTTAPDEAQRLLMTLNIEQTARDLQAAADFLLNHEAVNGGRIGIVGFCMGGQLALLAATVSQSYGAVVDFYGIHPNVTLDFDKLKVPVLGIFGEKDSSVPPDVVQALETNIRNAGGAIETHTYPNANHAFFNDSRPEVYNPTAAKDAWERTLTFLNDRISA